MLPSQAGAFSLSSLVNNEALAQADTADLSGYVDNSQNMALLQSNAPILPVKGSTLPDDTQIKIVADNALVPAATPISGDEEIDYSAEETSIYVVKKGDTFAQIAKMYDVSVDTILSVNDLKKGDVPKEGQILLILPFSGIEYTVVKGDTLESIATRYKIPKSDIVAANIDLGDNYKIIPGDKLIIPGAGMIEKAKASPSKIGKMPSSVAQNNMKSIVGYFINPLPSGHKTQGIHDKYAIDIGAPTGTPIRASASGIVTFAAMGWNGAYGNVVFIKHPNGTETRYAHMSRLNTSTGAEVSQGDVIGYVGSTGRSTGPHLHFEIRGAKNPF